MKTSSILVSILASDIAEMSASLIKREIETHSRKDENMWDQIYRASEVKSIPAPFPDTKGAPSVQILNADPDLGPGLLRIVMQPGDVIARHYHAGQAETLYILEGTFIDEGKVYSAGSELNVKPNRHHGPHTTDTGVTFLAMFTGNVDLTDFKLSAGVEELEVVSR